MPQIIRTVITVTVLHTAHTPEDVHAVERMSLGQIGHFIDEGDGLGESVTFSIDEIAPAEVADLERKMRGDGTFFQQDVADIYFPPHLRSDDESAQHWTVKVDQDADVLFRTLSTNEIRRRQAICQEQAASAHAKANERAAIDIARQEEALTREMLRRC
ncbi:hypothetical protein KIKIMORA_05010 [Brevundimonas phage vB_BpoS-Kikimora]|uniref:Uncharacterized protein n=2 Tax=Kikimoravirus TaxID=3425051 RepID=A0A9E7N273_9CAUD|nr:hypothetical protein KIKIMORA_05010 [Brevundimonas phage vB_BpoS-Kikimora]UTC28511.1 hypothetical protein GURKE_05090 [Brevundimonas phage vB_BpoS-Gurke]